MHELPVSTLPTKDAEIAARDHIFLLVWYIVCKNLIVTLKKYLNHKHIGFHWDSFQWNLKISYRLPELVCYSGVYKQLLREKNNINNK